MNIFIYHTFSLTPFYNEALLNSDYIWLPHRRNDWWRWITYSFCHGGLQHLTVNVALQILLGIFVEFEHKVFIPRFKSVKPKMRGWVRIQTPQLEIPDAKHLKILFILKLVFCYFFRISEFFDPKYPCHMFAVYSVYLVELVNWFLVCQDSNYLHRWSRIRCFISFLIKPMSSSLREFWRSLRSNGRSHHKI